MKFILGKKIQMSQIFDEKGKVFPVTLVEAGPCFITQIKNQEKDGYESIQIGFEKITKKSRIKKTMKGKEYKHLKEYKILKPETYNLKLKDQIDVSMFQELDKVNVCGTSKGKGFAGAVKRWGFKDKAKAHGAKDMRKLGSTGSRNPQRVIKGKKMP
ncbi:MAG: 50S ribosomal protein L3, partial [Candidatus Pacebacteria bacterium]|nr:50S ribosomal protein L3 [Candidatus Paceibacterota bacterium]